MLVVKLFFSRRTSSCCEANTRTRVRFSSARSSRANSNSSLITRSSSFMVLSELNIAVVLWYSILIYPVIQVDNHLDLCYYSSIKLTGEYRKGKKKMKLSKYLSKKEAGEKWKYVGTIWGSDEWTGTSDEFAEAIKGMAYNEKVVDHPAYSRKSGYYLQSGDIHYSGHLVDECVLKKQDD